MSKIRDCIYGFDTVSEKWTTQIRNKEYLLKMTEKYENIFTKSALQEK